MKLLKLFEHSSMYCPRINHFVRFNANGTIGKCGHMVNAPGFSSWEEMQSSDWLSNVSKQMEQDIWPSECRRCRDTEPSHSVRLASIDRHQILNKARADYLILGGVLDNVCNSACQSCGPQLSTKIGSLSSKNYIKIDNQSLVDRIPWTRVIEVDLNGGEPTASPAYRELLENLPESVKVLRVNTNGSRLLPNLVDILNRGTTVLVTLSLDGTELVHDYVRWPINWSTYTSVVDQYSELRTRFQNLKLQAWTTLHVLNAMDFDNIKAYAKQNNLDHSWAYLEQPAPLNLRYSNSWTQSVKHIDPDRIAVDKDNHVELDEFINRQDRLRNININDYL